MADVNPEQLEVPQDLSNEVAVRRFLTELIGIIIQQNKRIQELEGP